MKATTEQIEELEATIKQQNQILLHIRAELEAIKQCDPFDSVFIAYSVENISNMIETLTEKPMHVQAAEILGNIRDMDYGLAETKAELLRDQLQKGDWTLGGGKVKDSEVLMNVVDIVRDDRIYPHGAMNELADLLVDYLDAPEGPPEKDAFEQDITRRIANLNDRETDASDVNVGAVRGYEAVLRVYRYYKNRGEI